MDGWNIVHCRFVERDRSLIGAADAADWDATDLASTIDGLKKLQPKQIGHYVESFRYATGFNQE